MPHLRNLTTIERDAISPTWLGEKLEQVYFSPAGVLYGAAAQTAVLAGHGWPVADSDLCFTMVRMFWRRSEIVTSMLPFETIRGWASLESSPLGCAAHKALDNIGKRRRPFVGFDLHTPIIMGIVNVTPDSFSDGGTSATPEAALLKANRLLDEGAQIIDVGGESTRPGALPVSAEEQITRIIPVIESLAAKGVVVSVDTRFSSVMAAAIDAGALIVNDVSALEDDPAALAVIARSRASVILMHKQGKPATMQSNPSYQSPVLDVYDYLEKRLELCLDAGIERERICLDPGIGFGKTSTHNLALLAHLGIYHGLGCALLLGASRKQFIADVCGNSPSATDRLPGSLAAVHAALGHGVQILRVHDVAATKQAIDVVRAIQAAH